MSEAFRDLAVIKHDLACICIARFSTNVAIYLAGERSFVRSFTAIVSSIMASGMRTVRTTKEMFLFSLTASERGLIRKVARVLRHISRQALKSWATPGPQTLP